MKSGKSCLVISLCALMASPALAQTTDTFTLGGKPGFWNGLVRPYQPHLIAPVNFEDSSRIGKLIRAGNIYLSLRDAIALALENNLDLELARVQPKLNVATSSARRQGNCCAPFPPISRPARVRPPSASSRATQWGTPAGAAAAAITAYSAV